MGSSFALPHFTRYDLRPLLRPVDGTELGDWPGKAANFQPGYPFFAVDGPRLRRGWYMAEVLIESDQSYLNTSFTLCRDDGRKAKVLCLQLPARSGRLAKRLIWCGKGGEQLFFSPVKADCEFRILKLTLVRVSGIFARNRMKVRLARRLLSVPRRLTDRWIRYNASFSPNGVRISYGSWVKNVEPQLLRSDSCLIPAKLDFCLLMPVGLGDSLDEIARSVESIRAQSCKDWQLNIILSSSIELEARLGIEQLLREESRANVIDAGAYAWKNLLQESEGCYHLVCPPRGLLSPTALACLCYAVYDRANGRIFYADEDSINDAGRRISPRFKPAWNPDLLFSQNYVGEFVLYAPGVLPKAGPLLFGSEEAWDFSLFLGALRALSDAEIDIVHVPRVLFHQTGERDTHNYLCSCQRVLLDHFAKLGNRGLQVCLPESSNILRLSWPVPASEPLVSLLIPTRDKFSVLKLCVDSILEKTTYKNYEILILDNQSSETETLEYFDQLSSVPNVRILRYDAPFNYSAINNFGARYARGDIIGLVNNDVEVISEDWLTEMVGHTSRPDVGCVGAKLYYGDGRIQHAGVILGLGGLAGHVHKFYPSDARGYMDRLVSTQNFLAVTAACLLLRKEVFEEVGGLNEQDLKVAFNDVDLCLKVMTAGYRNVWTPWAELYHHESISRGIDNTRDKRARFDCEAKYLTERWVKQLGQDPYYSPFLTYAREDFSFGFSEKREVPLVR